MTQATDIIRVLHVDDEDNDRELTRMYLSRLTQSIEVVGAADASTALQVISSGSVDCILSDFQMPEIDGLEFLKRLKEKEIEIPFIFLTGQGNEGLAAKALREGATDYFSKHEGFAQYDRLVNSIHRSVLSQRQKQEKDIIERDLVQLGQILDQSENEIFIIDSGTLEIIRTNKTARRNLGYEKEEIEGMSGNQIVNFDNYPEVEDKIDEIRGAVGEARSFTIEHMRKDGTVYPVDVFVQTIEMGGRDLLVILGKDLTEQERVALELRQSEERYRLLFEREGDAIFIYNQDNFEIVDLNKSTCQLYGYSKDELIGQSCLMLSAEAENSKKTVKETSENDPRRVLLRWHKKKDGTVFPCELINHSLKIGEEHQQFSIVRDISLQYNLEVQLRSTAESLRKRVRELTCLFSISRLVEESGDRVEDIYYGTAQIISKAMQFPEKTCCRIVIGEKEYRTAIFRDSLLKISSPIYIDGEKAGRIDVSHFEEPLPNQEELFLSEEQQLLDVVAERLGHISDRMELSTRLNGKRSDGKASEKRLSGFRALFNEHVSVMLIIDPSTGQIVDANQAALGFYGYSKGEMTSLNISEINQLAPEKIEEERLRAVALKRNYFVFPHKLADGSIETVEVHSSPVSLEGEQLLFSIIHKSRRDISEIEYQDDKKPTLGFSPAH